MKSPTIREFLGIDPSAPAHPMDSIRLSDILPSELPADAPEEAKKAFDMLRGVGLGSLLETPPTSPGASASPFPSEEETARKGR